MHHVIIGPGPAGVIAAETLRRMDANAKITLIGEEKEPPYSRMAIPYFLSDQIKEEGTHLRHDKKHYKDLGIEVVQARVKSVDPKKKLLDLKKEKDIGYDKLLIATGASPIRPDIEGLDLPGVHTCWTLEDARHIESCAMKGEPVVLIGAGFIGSIILESLVERKADLTVVEMGDRMVPRMMDGTAGTMLKRWCESHGVKVVTETRVKKIEKGKKGLKVKLSGKGKDTISAKLVVVAAGVASNTKFLKGSGIDVDAGIRVNDRLCSSVPDIYAAGDVAQAKDLSTGAYSVLAVQPAAVEHGRIAAQNMAGHDTPHEGSLNMNVLDTIGLISSSFGAWDGVKGGDSARLSDEEHYRYLRLEFDGDRLVGGQAVGLTDHIGIIRGLIQTGLPLGAWKDKLMKSPERLAEAYIATAQGISAV